MLLRIVEEMRLGLRETDELARWGGEEFLLLLPQTAIAAATSLAERLCSRLAAATIDLAAQRLTVTGSFGVAQYRHGEDLDACLKRADEALYSAKALGRNRVVTSRTDRRLVSDRRGHLTIATLQTRKDRDVRCQ